MFEASVQYHINHIPMGDRRSGMKLKPRHITIHSTANPKSTARGERAWLTSPNNKNRYAGWHLCVDEREVVEAIPLDEVAWHAGDGGKGEGNSGSISIEICESGNREIVLMHTIMTVVDLLYHYKLKPKDVYPHSKWTRTKCPSILDSGVGLLWDNFVKEIEIEYNRRKDAGNPVCRIFMNHKYVSDGIVVDGVSYLPTRRFEKKCYQIRCWREFNRSVYLIDCEYL